MYSVLYKQGPSLEPESGVLDSQCRRIGHCAYHSSEFQPRATEWPRFSQFYTCENVKQQSSSSAGVIIPRPARVPREYLALTGTVQTEHFDV